MSAIGTTSRGHGTRGGPVHAVSIGHRPATAVPNSGTRGKTKDDQPGSTGRVTAGRGMGHLTRQNLMGPPNGFSLRVFGGGDTFRKTGTFGGTADGGTKTKKNLAGTGKHSKRGGAGPGIRRGMDDGRRVPEKKGGCGWGGPGPSRGGQWAAGHRMLGWVAVIRLIHTWPRFAAKGAFLELLAFGRWLAQRCAHGPGASRHRRGTLGALTRSLNSWRGGRRKSTTKRPKPGST